jgi:hypothetical protein
MTFTAVSAHFIDEEFHCTWFFHVPEMKAVMTARNTLLFVAIVATALFCVRTNTLFSIAAGPLGKPHHL